MNRVILLLVLTMVMGASYILAQQVNEPRTHYDSLALETPEDAVMTFVDAFQRQDYPTVFLIFSPHAQTRFQRINATYNYDQAINEEVAAEIFELLPPLSEWEHVHDGYVFDLIMLTAEGRDGLLIDLRGDVEILRTEEASIEGEPAVDVIVTVEDIDGEVRFRMVQSATERWRVYHVAAPGSVDDNALWAMPPRD